MTFKGSLLGIVALVSWFVAAPGIRAQEPRYEVLTVPAQSSGGSNFNLWSEYTLYRPPGSSGAREQLPILFFLHGAGRRGEDPSKVQSLPPLATAINGEDFPFYIAAPQARTGRSFSGAKAQNELKEFIDDVTALTNADPTRIYLAGQSMGGRGVWDLLMNHPDHFAAAIPIAGASDTPQRADLLVDIPIRAFHGRLDNTVPVQRSIELIDGITQAGGTQARLTIYEDLGHSVWWRAFKHEPELYDWMLQQSTMSVPEPSSFVFLLALMGICCGLRLRAISTRLAAFPRSNASLLRWSFAFLLLLTFVAMNCSANKSVADEISRYNTIVGTQTIGPAYGFTTESRLYESASRMREMGSNILKISLNDDAYADITGAPSDLTQLVQWGDFKRVIDMDFSHYHFWAYSIFPQAWKFGGYEQWEQDVDYQTIYNLTTHLLSEYNGTGKTFYIGHWEGDWHLVGQGQPESNPTQQEVDQMAQWYNVRQAAIEDAKSATQYANVDVFQYAEVNLVQKAIDDTDPNDAVMTLTNDVLPQTNIDYVSYSSWDSLGSLDPNVFSAQLVDAFNHIEAQLAPKSGLPTEKRVFPGEYGWRLPRVGTAEQQELLSREVALTAMEWGAPFALYWEFYDNSLNNGNNYGFWLIDDQDEKQPLYWTFSNYYDVAEKYLNDFQAEHGRLPTEAEFRTFALGALASVPTTPPPPGDFDVDFDVDGSDFLLWQTDPNVGNLADWEANYGVTPISGIVTTVPEPGSCVMLVLSLCSLTLQHRRR